MVGVAIEAVHAYGFHEALGARCELMDNGHVSVRIKS